MELDENLQGCHVMFMQSGTCFAEWMGFVTCKLEMLCCCICLTVLQSWLETREDGWPAAAPAVRLSAAAGSQPGLPGLAPLAPGLALSLASILVPPITRQPDWPHHVILAGRRIMHITSVEKIGTDFDLPTHNWSNCSHCTFVGS